MVQRQLAKKLLKLATPLGVVSLFAMSSHASTPQERGQWMAAMGESGLRAFYSSGSDFGEIVNRAVSYQTAQRLYQGAQGRPGAPDADDMRSRSNTWVTQNDSLIPIFDNVARAGSSGWP
ncbi:MAG: hypothetical protein VYE29_13675 [Pseudomonadota bacterium]|nr:hypothetical protein [Pseudomonadota bacterium]